MNMNRRHNRGTQYLSDSRATKYLGRDEDHREITYWFRQSFKAHAKRQHRRVRHTTKQALRELNLGF